MNQHRLTYYFIFTLVRYSRCSLAVASGAPSRPPSMPLPPMRIKALACTAGLGWRGGAVGLELACSTVGAGARAGARG